MIQDIWVLKSKKQTNGVYGTPMSLVEIQNYCYPKREKDFRKFGAICCAIAEAHPWETFKIIRMFPDGFWFELSKSGLRVIKYKKIKIVKNMVMMYGLHQRLLK
jgi:hypothetical protein